MPEELKSDANIVTKRESVEVITPDGHSLGGTKNLDSIFDKIEGGKNAEQAIKETMSSKPDLIQQEEPPAKEPAQSPAKEEKKVEEPPAKGLDQALTKTEDALKEPVLPKVDETEVPEEELTVLPHDKPKTAKRIQALLTKISKETEVRTSTAKERDEQAAKVKILQDQLDAVKPVDPKAQEEVKVKLEELAQLRRRYELDRDPAVTEKFDSKIKGADSTIEAMLKARGAGDGLIKTIQEEGGWAKFADSNRLIPITGEDEPVTAAKLAERIMKSLPYSEQRAIDQAVTAAIQAKKDKDSFFAEETKKANEYFSAREEAQKQAQVNNQKAHEEAVIAVNAFHAKLVKDNDFLVEKSIPSDATAEQKAAILEDNKWAKQIDAERVKMLNSKTLHEILAVVEQAVKYHNERRQVGKLTVQLAAAKKALDDYKAAGKTTGKSGSLAGGSIAQPTAKDKTPKGLEAALDLLEAGQKVDGNDE